MTIDEARLIRSSGNILLRSLGALDQSLLGESIREVRLPGGDVLVEIGATMDAIYFPTTALISIEDVSGAQVALVGREGVVGWPLLLGAPIATSRAVVRGADGAALRVRTDALEAACSSSATLRASLLRFVHVVMVQMARTMVSQLGHSLDQRVACWLLMRHDRLAGDVLLVRHDEIADELDARRASITDRLHVLEGEHLIRCHRGRIIVRDRPALERFAGDAYGGAEAQYRTLIAPFGKLLPAPAPVAAEPLRVAALAS